MKDRVTAVILAAGQGKRMKSSVQKQYMMLRGYPVVYYALKAFEESTVDDIILVTGQTEIEYCKSEIVEKYGFTKVRKIIAGGKERQDSVYNGLMEADCDYILIHDGARPLVTPEIIERTIEEVKKYRACTVGMPVKDTIKIADDEQTVVSTPPRKYLWQIQTPQAFEYSLIKKAHDLLREGGDSRNITDDCMLVEKFMKYPVRLTEGSYSNIKVTTPEDIQVAQALLGK